MPATLGLPLTAPGLDLALLPHRDDTEQPGERPRRHPAQASPLACPLLSFLILKTGSHTPVLPSRGAVAACGRAAGAREVLIVPPVVLAVQ